MTSTCHCVPNFVNGKQESTSFIHHGENEIFWENKQEI